ncbi:Hypothetical_protein [Hexamita inflata]|uniref:Hypothetical_protein n=1 Tax=Hexamita inflata TaxID=28002 RepID=A0AA86QSV7_9EUKA|nr:Hypothetical protein HINF_LOCUS47797 [Hexamita inflata]
METEKEATNPLSENMPSIQLVSHNEISKYQTPKAHEELNITHLCAKKCQKESVQQESVYQLYQNQQTEKTKFQQPTKLEPPPFELPKAENQELRDFPKEKCIYLLILFADMGAKLQPASLRKYLPTH